MTNPRVYCGSDDPGHRSTGCRPCQAERQRQRRARIAAGLPLRGPECALCGLMRGNSLGIKVYKYSLVRNFRASHTQTGWTNRQVASVGLCDRCLVDHGYANDRLRAAA